MKCAACGYKFKVRKHSPKSRKRCYVCSPDTLGAPKSRSVRAASAGLPTLGKKR